MTHCKRLDKDFSLSSRKNAQRYVISECHSFFYYEPKKLCGTSIETYPEDETKEKRRRNMRRLSQSFDRVAPVRGKPTHWPQSLVLVFVV